MEFSYLARTEAVDMSREMTLQWDKEGYVYTVCCSLVHVMLFEDAAQCFSLAPFSAYPRDTLAIIYRFRAWRCLFVVLQHFAHGNDRQMLDAMLRDILMYREKQSISVGPWMYAISFGALRDDQVAHRGYRVCPLFRRMYNLHENDGHQYYAEALVDELTTAGMYPPFCFPSIQAFDVLVENVFAKALTADERARVEIIDLGRMAKSHTQSGYIVWPWHIQMARPTSQTEAQEVQQRIHAYRQPETSPPASKTYGQFRTWYASQQAFTLLPKETIVRICTEVDFRDLRALPASRAARYTEPSTACFAANWSREVLRSSPKGLGGGSYWGSGSGMGSGSGLGLSAGLGSGMGSGMGSGLQSRELSAEQEVAVGIWDDQDLGSDLGSGLGASFGKRERRRGRRRDEVSADEVGVGIWDDQDLGSVSGLGLGSGAGSGLGAGAGAGSGAGSDAGKGAGKGGGSASEKGGTHAWPALSAMLEDTTRKRHKMSSKTDDDSVIPPGVTSSAGASVTGTASKVSAPASGMRIGLGAKTTVPSKAGSGAGGGTQTDTQTGTVSKMRVGLGPATILAFGTGHATGHAAGLRKEVGEGPKRSAGGGGGGGGGAGSSVDADETKKRNSELWAQMLLSQKSTLLTYKNVGNKSVRSKVPAFAGLPPKQLPKPPKPGAK